MMRLLYTETRDWMVYRRYWHPVRGVVHTTALTAEPNIIAVWGPNFGAGGNVHQGTDAVGKKLLASNSNRPSDWRLPVDEDFHHVRGGARGSPSPTTARGVARAQALDAVAATGRSATRRSAGFARSCIADRLTPRCKPCVFAAAALAGDDRHHHRRYAGRPHDGRGGDCHYGRPLEAPQCPPPPPSGHCAHSHVA